MASSRHSVMQCSSLPQTPGRGKTAIPPSISRHLTPHTSTHRLQPVHLLASTTGTHFSFTARVPFVSFRHLFHDNRAFHPWVGSALKMHHALLVKLLGVGLTLREHGRGELALLAEYAVRHAYIRILEGHGLACFDRDGFGTERLHWPFLPNARARQHFDRDAAYRMRFRRGGRRRKMRPRLARRLRGGHHLLRPVS